MSASVSLFLQGFAWGCGAGVLALTVCMVWGSFVKSVNSL